MQEAGLKPPSNGSRYDPRVKEGHAANEGGERHRSPRQYGILQKQHDANLKWQLRQECFLASPLLLNIVLIRFAEGNNRSVSRLSGWVVLILGGFENVLVCHTKGTMDGGTSLEVHAKGMFPLV